MAKADRKKGAGQAGGSIYDNTDFSRYELGGRADERKGLYDNTDFSRYCTSSEDYCAEKVRGLPEKEKQGALVVLGQLNEDVKDSERRQVFDDYLAYREAVEAGRFKDAPKEEFGPGLQGFLLKRGEAEGDKKRYFGKESAVRRELTAEEERAKAAEEAKKQAAAKGIAAGNAGSENAPSANEGGGVGSNFGGFLAQEEENKKNRAVQELARNTAPFLNEAGGADAQEIVGGFGEEPIKALGNMLSILATGSLGGFRAITIGGRSFTADDVVEVGRTIGEFKDVYDKAVSEGRKEEAFEEAFGVVTWEKLKEKVISRFLQKMGLNKVQGDTLGAAGAGALPRNEGRGEWQGTGIGTADYSRYMALDN